MPTRHHGSRVSEESNAVRPIENADVSTIGIIVTAPGADNNVFPVGKNILATSVRGALEKAGDTGTLPYALDAIADQANSKIVIMRVDEGATEAETTSNVIAGVQKLPASSALGVTPRILGAPGLDNLNVAAELAGVAQQMRGFAYLSASGATTKEEAAQYRQNFGQREAMIIWPDFTGWDTKTNSERTMWATARALGTRAKLDATEGWSRCLSNVPVNGVTGISEQLSWNLQSPNTDVGYLIDNEVASIINRDGFRFWNCRTCSADPLFAFESYTRTAQAMAETIAEAHFWAVGKKLTPAIAKNIIAGVNSKIQELKSQGHLIGGECWFDPERNNQELLYSGKLYISYDYTPVPPLEDLNFIQQVTGDYLVDFSAQIAAA